MNTSNDFQWLSISGEIAALLQRTDWGSSSFGAVADWTPGLRIALAHVMKSDFPMALAWGPRLELLYNERFIPLLGRRHPDAFGRALEEGADAVIRADACRQVMLGGKSLLAADGPEPRQEGTPGDASPTFAYLPFPHENGTTGGVLIVPAADERLAGRNADHAGVLAKGMKAIARADTLPELLAALLEAARHITPVQCVWLVMQAKSHQQCIGHDTAWSEAQVAALAKQALARHESMALEPGKTEGVPCGSLEHVDRLLMMMPVGTPQLCAALGAACNFPDGEKWPCDDLLMLKILAQAVGTALDHLQVRERLGESEQRFRILVEGTALATWEADREGRIVEPSLSWCTFTGQSEQECTGLGWKEAIHPEDREEVERQWWEAVESRQPLNVEYRLRNRVGDWYWTNVRAAPLLDSAGNVSKWVGMNIDVSDRKEAESRARELALHDVLTGLPNRRLAFEYAGHLLAATSRRNACAALLFIDLDRFKPINDTYGHEAGDRLLQTVAQRLRNCVRGEDLLGRLGGDEFVILLPFLQHEEDAQVVAQHVLDSLSEPIGLDEIQIDTGASIGVSFFPKHGADLDELIRAADLAMYESKRSGGKRAVFYDRELETRGDLSSSIERRIKRALATHGFTLCYQPVVDLRTGRLAAVEALIRLLDDEGKVDRSLGPDRFIQVAETTGLIVPLGEWVAKEACRQYAQWKEAGLPEFVVAINVSPIQFRERGFCQRLEKIIHDFGMDPHCLEVEITESAVMEDIAEAIDTLKALKCIGVHVALDDFGTGYSSLSHLGTLPLDKLKVDRSFVKRASGDKTGRAITDAILALGHTLELKVVGEGIENTEALDYLNDRGCDLGQGYFFSAPLLPPDFAAWCRAH